MKWSAVPVEEAELEKIARAMRGRPLPSNLPRDTHYAIFIPKSASGKTVTSSGARIVEADAVLKVMR